MAKLGTRIQIQPAGTIMNTSILAVIVMLVVCQCLGESRNAILKNGCVSASLFSDSKDAERKGQPSL